MANEPKHLYQLEDFFELIIGGATITIDEPIDWDGVKITGERDKELFGMNNHFIDEKLNLTFLKIRTGPDRLPGGRG